MSVLTKILITEEKIVDNSRRKKIKLIGLAIASFALASSIYLCFCSTDLLFYDLFCIDTEAEWIQSIRSIFSNTQVPVWFKHNLPDALWLMSFLLIMEVIWSSSENCYKNIFIYSLFLMAIMAEFFQYYHLIPGTGDWMDVIYYLLTLLTYYIFKLL